MSIYTRTGDQGLTSLFSGKKLSKSDLVFSVIGSFDELNSSIGLVRSFLPQTNEIGKISEILVELQKVILSISSELAGSNLKLEEKYVKSLETLIDFYDHQLPELSNFIIPGGSKAASLCHLARTTCRRTERMLTMLAQKSEINANILSFTNRLSDILFVLSRYLNKVEGVKEELWETEKNTNA